MLSVAYITSIFVKKLHAMCMKHIYAASPTHGPVYILDYNPPLGNYI